MVLPFLRSITAKFRSTPQLAHMSARQVHELQYHIREAHREWEEVKLALKKIKSLSNDLPEGTHHDALAQVFKYIDTFSDVERRYDKRLATLVKHVEQIEHTVEETSKEYEAAKKHVATEAKKAA